jgi:hypothetical protein
MIVTQSINLAAGLATRSFSLHSEFKLRLGPAAIVAAQLFCVVISGYTKCQAAFITLLNIYTTVLTVPHGLAQTIRNPEVNNELVLTTSFVLMTVTVFALVLAKDAITNLTVGNLVTAAQMNNMFGSLLFAYYFDGVRGYFTCGTRVSE